jgi:hypothetical protein
MNSTRETAPVQQTPEQLVKLLELQLGARRARREKSPASRAVGLTAGIVMILVGAAAALLVLQHLISDMRASGTANEGANGQSLLVTE